MMNMLLLLIGKMVIFFFREYIFSFYVFIGKLNNEEMVWVKNFNIRYCYCYWLDFKC